MPTKTKVTSKAVGVVRVSRVKDDSVASLNEQRERIENACEREGLALAHDDVFEEPDVSGGKALEQRPGLSKAVAMVEAGEAGTIVVAYFDRLVRSLAVQAEVVSRVEAAGGRILSVDVGQITNGSAGQWLSGNVLGLVSEYQRRTTAERTQDAKRRAIADGIPTFAHIPPGFYRPRDADGKLLRVPLEHDPATAAPMRAVWEKRSHGASIEECRTWLREEHNIKVTYSQLTGIFRSRIYLGELHFGELVNTSAHDPLVDAQTFARVQKLSLPRGRKPKSERLLARLGVLRCGTCDARMVVGQARANGRDYPMYRCPPNGDCPQRVTISANIAENTIIDAVKQLLEGIEGSAALDDGIAGAEREVERAEAELDAAVEAFSGLDDVATAQKRLLDLREAWNRARDHLDDLRSRVVPDITVTATDWDNLTIDERRDLIRAVVDRALVISGKGSDRIRVEPRV